MTVAIRTATRIQDQDDAPPVLGAGQHGYALTWDNAIGAFVATALFTGGLLATGAVTGATSQAQRFTSGIIGPSWKPAANGTAALQLQDAAGTAIVTLDTTNSRLGVGAAPTTARLASTAVSGGVAIEASAVDASTVEYTALRVNAAQSSINYNLISAWGNTGLRRTNLRLFYDGTNISYWSFANADNETEVRIGLRGSSLTTGSNKTAMQLQPTWLNTNGSTLTVLNIAPTINQAGGGTGITRGIYINPTLTSAADWRAIESVRGNVLLCTTTGSVGIGTTAPESRLDIAAGALTMREMTAPAAPAADNAVIYAVDNGSGKTQLMVRFASGAAQQIAIEP